MLKCLWQKMLRTFVKDVHSLPSWNIEKPLIYINPVISCYGALNLINDTKMSSVECNVEIREFNTFCWYHEDTYQRVLLTALLSSVMTMSYKCQWTKNSHISCNVVFLCVCRNQRTDVFLQHNSSSLWKEQIIEYTRDGLCKSLEWSKWSKTVLI